MQNQNSSLKFSGKIVTVFILLLLSFTSCKKESAETTQQEYRAIAWNHISAQEKATVVVNWETALVNVPSANNPEAASVMFNTNQDALLGPIVVFISIKNKTVLGIGPRF